MIFIRSESNEEAREGENDGQRDDRQAGANASPALRAASSAPAKAEPLSSVYQNHEIGHVSVRCERMVATQPEATTNLCPPEPVSCCVGLSRALNHPPLPQAQPKLNVSKPSSTLPNRHSMAILTGGNDGGKRSSYTTSLRLHGHLVPRCVASNHHRKVHPNHEPVLNGDNGDGGSVAKTEDLAGKSLWVQMKEVMLFSGPATGLWICAPLMSLISTAIIGQGSSTELAALGPGTVFCDNMNLLFMFLSIATSNMVATSLAKGDKKDVQHQISILLFVGLACGTMMLLFTQFLGSQALNAFSGPRNLHIVPVATKYVKIRGLAWPAVLYGLVAQSSSLGMKDSMGPLKALLVASAVNGTGHLVLCKMLGYGITGAAWATMASQIVAAYMMIEALNKKGYNSFSISVPSPSELLHIFGIAAPVFVTMFSKVAFYSLVTYFATSMGTMTLAAHQVMMQMYSMCVVWGEPLSQTAQSFMPELMYSRSRSLEKARTLLKSLMIIGAILGIVISGFGAAVPGLFPNIFTSDTTVIQQMHRLLIPFFVALSATPCTHSLEGTLLAGRDFKFMSLSMSGCFSLGGLLLLLISSRGYGLPGCWCALVGFQWARFFLALQRLLSPTGVLYSENVIPYAAAKLKAT